MICYFLPKSVRNHDDKSKNLHVDHYFFNVIFSINIGYTGSKFSLHIPQTHLEGTVSQIFYLDPGFYFMPKIGKHCEFFFFFSKSQRIRTRVKAYITGRLLLTAPLE